MASKKPKQEPIRWVTIRGKHFPVMPDGTLGFGREDDEVDDKIKSKADTLPNYVTKNKDDDEIVGSSEHYDIKASSHSPIVRRGSGTGFGKRKTQYELFNKDGTSVERNADDYSIEGYGYSTLKQATEEVNKLEYLKDVMKASKPVSRNAKYDTSRANKESKPSTKKKPTALEAFKENSRQLNVALEEGTKRNVLEVHYTDMTGKLYKSYWNGAVFTSDKINQDMAKKYGKKAGIYKASFKKPKEWE